MHVTIRQLQVFLTLSQCHSFSQTGHTLGLTQSAVSRAMVELEGQLNVRLLDRTTREVLLTDAGQLLAQRAAPLLQELAGPQIQLVDSAVAMAEQTAQVLSEIGLANPQRHLPNYEYYVTDIPLRFQTIGERFLGRSLGEVEKVDW